MVSVEDTRLRGAGVNIKRKIWNAARDTIQEWTGEELTECSLYGIRVYTEGSILATHVDRMPLVSSAILNVDQDVDEPWPIEVYAHDGKAYNITMEVSLLPFEHNILQTPWRKFIDNFLGTSRGTWCYMRVTRCCTAVPSR